MQMRVWNGAPWYPQILFLSQQLLSDLHPSPRFEQFLHLLWELCDKDKRFVGMREIAEFGVSQCVAVLEWMKLTR